MDKKAIADPIIGETNPNAHPGLGFGFKDYNGTGKPSDGTKLLRRHIDPLTFDYNTKTIMK